MRSVVSVRLFPLSLLNQLNLDFDILHVYTSEYIRVYFLVFFSFFPLLVVGSVQ